MSHPFWSRLPSTTPALLPSPLSRFSSKDLACSRHHYLLRPMSGSACAASSSEQSDGRVRDHYSGWAAAVHCEAGVQPPAGEVQGDGGASSTGCSRASCAPFWTSSLTQSRLR